MFEHEVQPGESLWSIAEDYFQDGERWRSIANENFIQDPNTLIVGQKLKISGSRGPACMAVRTHGGMEPAFIPAHSQVFLLADEINPFRRKAVRRVITNPAMQAEVASHLGKPVKIFPDPTRFGFKATDIEARTSIGRHAMGMKPSPYISASSRLFGASRFKGHPFWIDLARAEAAGARFHQTSEIIADLDRIAAKTKNTAKLDQIARYRALVAADAEILARGDIPAGSVKGSGAMALTRGLQGVQIVGFAMTAVELTQAAQESVETESIKPLAAETVRQAGGWAAAWAGMKLGAAGGALVGVSTGPGAIATGIVGGVAGGFAGYFGFDWIADHIHEN